MTLPALALSFGISLGAAASSSQEVLDWAQAALQRNDALQVVATDPATGIITVRVKRTGQLWHVRADELVAALPGAPSEAAAATNSAQATAGEASSAAQEPEGRVLLSGRGYRIAVAGPAEAAASDGAAASSEVAGASASSHAAGGALLTSIAVERRHDPIVCQGARLLHIDSRNLQFDGDAVSAEGGCEVHITNSRIVAGGIGVLARSASVHIDNSSIEGSAGSVEASDGAQVYARSSTFGGLIRRFDTAAFHDMGGNVGD